MTANTKHDLVAVGRPVPRIVQSLADLAAMPLEARQRIAQKIAPPQKKQRKRRRTLAQARAEADKAGFSVKAATLQPDGGVRLEFGARDVAAAADDDEAEQWINQHAHRS